MKVDISDLSIMSQDLEMTMRCIEVYRIWNKDWLETDFSKMAKISMLFMEASIDRRDPRYLNTALKINDRIRGEQCKNVDLEVLEVQENWAFTQLRISLGLDT